MQRERQFKWPVATATATAPNKSTNPTITALAKMKEWPAQSLAKSLKLNF